jgi:hypothetical protein
MAQTGTIEVANWPEPDEDSAAVDCSAPAEARSWEPPCWPSEDMIAPLPKTHNAALGGRGPLRFFSHSTSLKITRH